MESAPLKTMIHYSLIDIPPSHSYHILGTVVLRPAKPEEKVQLRAVCPGLSATTKASAKSHDFSPSRQGLDS